MTFWSACLELKLVILWRRELNFPIRKSKCEIFKFIVLKMNKLFKSLLCVSKLYFLTFNQIESNKCTFNTYFSRIENLYDYSLNPRVLILFLIRFLFLFLCCLNSINNFLQIIRVKDPLSGNLPLYLLQHMK